MLIHLKTWFSQIQRKNDDKNMNFIILKRKIHYKVLNFVTYLLNIQTSCHVNKQMEDTSRTNIRKSDPCLNCNRQQMADN